MAPNEPRPTKAQRREAARAKAKALREAEERRARRSMITRRSLIGAGALAAVGTTGWLVYDRRRDAAEAAARASSLPPAGGGIVEEKAAKKGVPAPVLADGSWTYGKASALDSIIQGAPVLDVYFDYSCHFCADFETLHAQEISALLDAGRITLALHPSDILTQDWTDMVMNAMGLVLDEAPDTALAFHTAALGFFSEVFASKDGSRLTVENLVTAATSAGVPADITGRFDKTYKNNTYGPWTVLAQESFQSRGLEGTPTVFLGGEKIDLSTLSSPTALTDLVDGLDGAGAAGGSAGAGEPTSPAAGTGEDPASAAPTE